MSAPNAPLALLAGAGSLPADLARAARRAGRRVVAIAFPGLSGAGLESEVDALEWVPFGQLEALLAALRGAGAQEVVMAGKVPKTRLFEDRARAAPDARAEALLEGLAARGDDAILGALAAWLESEGVRVLGQGELAPELLAPVGRVGDLPPPASHVADVRYAWPIAKALGAWDIGQALVVKERSVVAVEAVEGTDATIRRGGALAHGAVCVLKVAKPGQDVRFDLPAVGPDTIRALAEAGGGTLAVEAGATLLLDRERLRKAADARGIAVVGVREGPQGLEGLA